MKIGKLIVFLFGFILFFSMVSALTTINIKTLPYQDLFITPIKTGASFETLASPQFFGADEYGNLKIDFEDFSVSNFEVFVSLKDSDGNTLYRTQSSENFVTGTEVFFTAAPEGSELVEDVDVGVPEPEDLDLNVSLGDEVNDSSELNDSLNGSLGDVNSSLNSLNSSALSGGVVGKQDVGFNLRKLIFILAGLVFLIIVYIIIKEEAEKGKFKNFGNMFKFSFGGNKDRTDKVISKSSLERTKEELRDTKEKVKALEKKEKIEEVRARLNKDEESLKRLEDEQDEIIRKKR